MINKHMANDIEEAKYNYKRLLHQAKRYAEIHACEKCGNKVRRIVPLHEYGDPFMPSSVVLFCARCGASKAFAKAPIEQAKAYAEEVMGEKGFKKAGPEVADELIKKPKSPRLKKH